MFDQVPYINFIKTVKHQNPSKSNGITDLVNSPTCGKEKNNISNATQQLSKMLSLRIRQYLLQTEAILCHGLCVFSQTQIIESPDTINVKETLNIELFRFFTGDRGLTARS